MKRQITTSIITPNETTEDLTLNLETQLRPTGFAAYTGQERVKEKLQIYIQAAKERNEPLDHVLLYGPPGLGKTTLSNIIASEMNANIKTTSGPAIERAGDMVAMLYDLSEGDILFVDEIHRLSKVVEEIMYPAMEDFILDIMSGKGTGAKSVRLNLQKFTLIGATTRIGLMTAPLRDRFGVIERLEPYTVPELSKIVTRTARVLGTEITEDGASEIARRSRGTPRIANRLLKRVRDFAQVKYCGIIDYESSVGALDILDVDKMGLDMVDRNVLTAIIEKFGGGPVGLDTISAATGEDAETIEDVYEPYLIQLGYIQRTSRGRIVTPLGYNHFGYKKSEVF